MNYSVLLAKEKETTDKTTPTQESTQAADKLIDRKIDELKDALAGMRAARDKGDEASLKVYRTQACSALVELQKVSNEQILSEATATEKKKAKRTVILPPPSPLRRLKRQTPRRQALRLP
jgi:hypothetical protein